MTDTPRPPTTAPSPERRPAMTTFPIHRRNEDPAAFSKALDSLRDGDTVSVVVRLFSDLYSDRTEPATLTGRVWHSHAALPMVGHVPLIHSVVQSILSIERPALTVGELDAMPLGSFVMDAEGDVWVKHLSGQWVTEDGGSVRTTVLATFAPRPHSPTSATVEPRS